MESNYYILADETPTQDLGGGVSRQVLGFNDQLMMVKVLFTKGAVGAMHSHVHTQTTYCAGGVFDFTIGDVTTRIKEGDGVYIPSDAIHGVLCIEAGALIDTFNPVRKDFL